jgi:hypothetical protein
MARDPRLIGSVCGYQKSHDDGHDEKLGNDPASARRRIERREHRSARQTPGGRAAMIAAAIVSSPRGPG